MRLLTPLQQIFKVSGPQVTPIPQLRKWGGEGSQGTGWHSWLEAAQFWGALAQPHPSIIQASLSVDALGQSGVHQGNRKMNWTLQTICKNKISRAIKPFLF